MPSLQPETIAVRARLTALQRELPGLPVGSLLALRDGGRVLLRGERISAADVAALLAEAEAGG